MNSTWEIKKYIINNAKQKCILLLFSCQAISDSFATPGSSVHGISQAILLKWIAIPSPGDLPISGIEFMPPTMAVGFFTTEPPGKPQNVNYKM